MRGELFHCSQLRGYITTQVDDPRNTDNAWMETVAYHFHCSPETVACLHLGGGDDAASATWLRMDSAAEPRYAKLYASHRVWTDVRRTPFTAFTAFTRQL